MPECQTCDRYFAPNAVLDDGTCPKCRSQVVAVTETRTAPKIPWHFWLILVLAAGYIGWRLLESIAWLFGRIF